MKRLEIIYFILVLNSKEFYKAKCINITSKIQIYRYFLTSFQGTVYFYLFHKYMYLSPYIVNIGEL